jgi:hypothetical protein
VPARGGDRRAGHQQLGAPLGVGGQLLAQLQGDEAAVAKVAEGGDPGGQRRSCPGPALLRQLVVVDGGEVADGVVAGVQDQVGVAVDQPRQQEGRPAKVDQRRPRRRVGPGDVDVGDAPTVDQHQGRERNWSATPSNSRAARTASIPATSRAATAWLHQMGILDGGACW